MIREGSAADVPAIMRVMLAAFDSRFGEAWTESQCLSALAIPGSLLIVAGDDDPAGFALSRFVAAECELMLIAVRPEHRRTGVGKALLTYLIDEARRLTTTSIFLEMRQSNDALNLYLRAGFAEVGRRASYYRGGNGETHDAITYRLRLV